MSWYRTGKASIYKGTREMTGYGTQWADNKHSINRGHIVLLPGSGTVQLYEIETVNSDSSITLTTDFTGETVSQGDYAIINTLTSTVPDFARRLAAQLQYNQELFDSIAEWVKSEEADVVIILPDGSEVKMPSLQQMKRDIEGASKLNKEVHKIEDDSTVIWKGNGLFKEIGVGYPRDGTTPASRFGYHSKESTTPRLYMTDGSKQATLQFNLADGMVATREWVGEAVNRDVNANWVSNPNKTMRWGAHNDYLYAKQDSKSYPTLLIEKSDLVTINGKLDLYSTGNYTSFTMGKGDKTGVLFQVSPYKETADDSAFMSIVEKDQTNTNKSSFNFPREGAARTAASRQWVNERFSRGPTNSFILPPKGATGQSILIDNNNAGVYDMSRPGWLFRVASDGRVESTGVTYKVLPYGTNMQVEMGINAGSTSGHLAVNNGSQWSILQVPNDGGTKVFASREWVWSATGWGISNDWAPQLTDHNRLTTPCGTYYYGTSSANKPSTSVGFGAAIVTRYSPDISHHLYINNYGSSVLAVRRMNGNAREDFYVLTSNNYTIDGNGFYKKASPIITIKSNGDYEVNRESKGATVKRISEGVYKVEGVLGFHSDAVWGGGDGGIDIPVDKNKQPLIWVDYEVEKDGSIVIRTYHRVHKDAPVFAQNNKEGYLDGTPIDIPDGRFLSVRVEMPEDSEFNIQERKNKEAAIKAEKEQRAKVRAEELKKIDSTINDVYNNGTEEQLKLPFFEEKEV